MINLPHTLDQQKEFKLLHKKAKQIDDRKLRLKTVHDIHEKIMLYQSIEDYNNNANTKCRFSNSDNTENICQKEFKQTLKHYTIHGNCCQKCSNYFNYNK